MKQLLSYGGAALLIGAFLDCIWQTGLGKPAPWLRDGILAGVGIACWFVAVKFRKQL